MHTFTGHVARLIVAAAVLWPAAPRSVEGQKNAAERARMACCQDFTQAEKRKLEAGELVVRRADERQKELKLIGGTSWQLIEAPIGKVWDVLIDMKYYRRILPQVSDVRLIEDRERKPEREPEKKPERERERERTFFIKHGNELLSICYYVDIKINSGRKEIRFRMDPREECTVKAGWGFYLLRPHGKDRTVLVYGIMADIGEGIILALLRDQIHEWMLKVPWMVKRLVESERAKQHAAAARAPRRSPR